jgi:hypothetical protein
MGSIAPPQNDRQPDQENRGRLRQTIGKVTIAFRMTGPSGVMDPTSRSLSKKTNFLKRAVSALSV